MGAEIPSAVPALMISRRLNFRFWTSLIKASWRRNCSSRSIPDPSCVLVVCGSPQTPSLVPDVGARDFTKLGRGFQAALPGQFIPVQFAAAYTRCADTSTAIQQCIGSEGSDGSRGCSGV